MHQPIFDLGVVGERLDHGRTNGILVLHTACNEAGAINKEPRGDAFLDILPLKRPEPVRKPHQGFDPRTWEPRLVSDNLRLDIRGRKVEINRDEPLTSRGFE